MGPGNKRSVPWDQKASWSRVDVGDDFMLGSTEGGFMGLEVLGAEEAKLFGHHDVRPQRDADDAAADDLDGGTDAAEVPKKSKGSKRVRTEEAGQNKRPRVSADAAVDTKATPDPATLAALTAKIAALEAENTALKGQEQPKQQKKKKKEKTTKEQASLAKGASSTSAAEEDVRPAASQTDMTAWAPFDLHPKVAEAIAQMGFGQPTPIQQECLLPAVRDRRDVIGAAQTGSGKTLAFGLPILQRLLAQKEAAAPKTPPKLKALILTPTRELALQCHHGIHQTQAIALCSSSHWKKMSHIVAQHHVRQLLLAPMSRTQFDKVCEHLQRVGKVCGVWVVPIVGGISPVKQERMLKKLPEVVVATPGRLWELMQQGHAHLTDMAELSFFVLDEADRMVQQGHFQEMEQILEHIHANRGENNTQSDDFDQHKLQQSEERGIGASDDEEDQSEEPSKQKRLQIMVFSATLTLPLHLRRRLNKSGGGSSGSATLDRLMDKIPFGPKPKIVDLTSDRKLADKVEEAALTCGNAERDEYLYYILAQHPGRTLVFVNAISAVRRVAALLKLLALPAQALHASMQQRQRLKALDRFKADPAGVLVATDVAARGLDIPEVSCVIHYQVPASADVYVHRSGRTARAAQEGIAIALVTPQEAGRYQGLQKALSRPLPEEFPVDATLMPAVHKRVRLAVRLDEVQHLASKEKAELTWRQRSAAEAEIEVSDEEEIADPEVDNTVRGKGGRKTGGRQTGTADAVASAAKLQQELASCLGDPLVPRFSHRYFTGGAAAAIAAHQTPATATDQPATADGDTMHAPTVTQAVTLANKLQGNRMAAVSAAQQSSKQQLSKKKKSKPAWQATTSASAARQLAEDRALQAAVRKSQTKKEARQRGSKLVVVPAAFGREKQGPDALQALRTKLAAVRSKQAKKQ